MITIYLKSFCGEIQTLDFVQGQQVNVGLVKLRLNKKGYITHVFKEDEDSKEEQKDLSDDVILKDNDVLSLFYARQEFTQNEVEKFENILKKRILLFDEFKESIVRNKAIIAGGSVLSIFGNYPINDLDIYVNFSNAKELMKDLYVLGCSYDITTLHRAPAYDQSFFRKNNIIARFHTVMNDNCFYDRGHIQIYGKKKIDIDIMLIPDNIPLENIVTNFDLTFCQVWWDGEKLNSYDIDDVRNKSGSLNPDYVKSYLEMNQFIIKRLYKYKNRGFQIKIDISGVTENIVAKTKKTFEDERWLLTSVVNYILEDLRFYGYIDLQPQILSLSSIYDLYGKDVVDAYIVKLYVEKVTYYPPKYKSLYNKAFSYIMDVNSQQASDNIISRWKREKFNEYREYTEYIKKLRKDFIEEKKEKIIKFRLESDYARREQDLRILRIQEYMNNMRQREYGQIHQDFNDEDVHDEQDLRIQQYMDNMRQREYGQIHQDFNDEDVHDEEIQEIQDEDTQ